jgi:hypothetical protein
MPAAWAGAQQVLPRPQPAAGQPGAAVVAPAGPPEQQEAPDAQPQPAEATAAGGLPGAAVRRAGPARRKAAARPAAEDGWRCRAVARRADGQADGLPLEAWPAAVPRRWAEPLRALPAACDWRCRAAARRVDVRADDPLLGAWPAEAS